MSKVGKKPITIPQGLEVKKNGDVLEFKNKNGILTLKILPQVEAVIENDKLSFVIKNNNDLQAQANWGTMRALAQNAIIGLTDGFKKVLAMQGVGFRANLEGSNLVLNIGFSHPVRFALPEGVKVLVEKNNIIISGIDKALVGQIAAQIRALKKPNPYLGTGIHYKDEIIKTKAGKKAMGTTGASA
jgi:large subunit ribosomal protein L6